MNKLVTSGHTSESPDCAGGVVLLERLLFRMWHLTNRERLFLWTIPGLLFGGWHLQRRLMNQLSRSGTDSLWEWIKEVLQVVPGTRSWCLWKSIRASCDYRELDREGHSPQSWCKSQSDLAGIVSALSRCPKPGLSLWLLFIHPYKAQFLLHLLSYLVSQAQTDAHQPTGGTLRFTRVHDSYS